MALLLVLLSLLTSLLAVFLFVVRRLLTPTVPLKGTTNIPGPTEGIRWPILGDALWFWNAQNGTDLFGIVGRLCAMRDKVMSFYLGRKLVIYVTDAKLLESVMSANKCQAKDQDFYEPFIRFSDGIFTRNGEKWLHLRRPMDKMLHTKNTDDYHLIFIDKAKILCSKVGKKCGKGFFDVLHFIETCILDIYTETLLGIPGTQQLEETMAITRTIPEGNEWAFKKMLKIQYKIEWLYRLSPLFKQELKLKDKLRPTLRKMVDDCYANMKEKGVNPADPDFEPQNYIEASIQRGIIEGKLEEGVVFSFLDSIIAGYDTGSVAASTTLLFLAMHPEYQEKAYQEQIEIMNDSLDAPSRDELSRMDYLEMTFNEALRHVSVPGIARTVSSQFTVDGYIFPEGATIYFAYNHIHKDPKYWERPNDYYPDHFLPEKVAKRSKGAFLPFSFGGRSCPGKLFALHSNKLILSMLLRRFKFTTNLKFEEMVYKYYAMVVSVKGYPLKATPRVSLSDGV